MKLCLGERKDIKPITGMFELLQEEGPTTQKERRSTRMRNEHVQGPQNSWSSVDPEANCGLVPSWKKPHTEHLTHEDYKKTQNDQPQPQPCSVCLHWMTSYTVYLEVVTSDSKQISGTADARSVSVAA